MDRIVNRNHRKQEKKSVLVAGAGRIGQYVVRDVVEWAGNVTVSDRSDRALERIPEQAEINTLTVEMNELKPHLEHQDLVISCLPYRLNEQLTEQCISTGTSMVDLGGSTERVRRQLKMNARAEEAGVTVIPDCGFSPGITNVLAADLIDRGFTDEILIRVGGLPVDPEPPLKYQLLFSVEGLVEEYTAPVLVLEDGRRRKLDPLTRAEPIRPESFPGVDEVPDFDEPLIAFLTSGGSSTLPYTYEGTVDKLNDKSIRFRGHLEAIRELIEEHGRENLGGVLRERLDDGREDVVLLAVTGRSGEEREGYVLYETYEEDTTAMMKTTGAGICSVAELIASGVLSETGVLKQEEQVPAGPFLTCLRRRNVHVQSPFS